MNKNITKALAILLTTLTPSLALACGLLIAPDPLADRWDYVNSSNEQTFINYEQGKEKLLMSISLTDTRNVVWIVPIPSEPSQVTTDVVTSLPQLSGEEVGKKAKLNLSDTKTFLLSTQIYPIAITSAIQNFLAGSTGAVLSDSNGIDMPGAVSPNGADVIVYSHLEKEGITNEVLTAKTSNGLYDYFSRKNLTVDQNALSVLNSYIGKNFSFSASWISNQAALQPNSNGQQRAILISFPTQKIFDPMIPMSVYGDMAMPTTIRVMGLVSPEIPENITRYVNVSYFRQESFTVGPDLKNFYSNQIGGSTIGYTRIDISAPSNLLTKDLWMNLQSPARVSLAFFISNYPNITTGLLLVVLSVLIGCLAGVWVFKEARTKRGLVKFAIIGLCNCLSLLGLIVAVWFSKTREVKEEDKELLAQLQSKGYPTRGIQGRDTRKILFVIVYSILFLIISAVTISLIKAIL